MVGRWGMSDAIGPVAVLPADGQGPFLPGVSETSEETQRQVDEQVRLLVESSHDQVTRLLTDHRDQLESLAQTLLKAETLDALDAYAAAGVPAHVEESSSDAEPVLTPRTSA
jgi:cell division protease FtsH